MSERKGFAPVMVALSVALLFAEGNIALAQGVEAPVEEEKYGEPRFMPVEVFPVCVYQPPPVYPESARMEEVTGAATLWIFVKADGSVGAVRLYSSSGDERLDAAALEAAWNTRWTPAMDDGLRVGVWTTLQYRFVLCD